MGDTESADRDLRAAFALDGANLEIGLALLAFHDSDELGEGIARSIAAHPDASRRRKAIVLSRLARASGAAVVATRDRRGIRGLLSWSGSTVPTVRIASCDIPLTPISHPSQAGFGLATFNVAVSQQRPVSLVCREDGGSSHVISLLPMLGQPDTGPTNRSNHIMVVVPIFAGREVTRECLQALAVQVTDRPVEVVLVDDASPDPDLTQFAQTFSARQNWIYLRNDCNSGFAASVNRGVQTSSAGHILVLNADAILPRDAIGRMLAAAATGKDIGTVVPFSNDGGFTSFPRMHQRNRMPTRKEAAAIDAAAQRQNHGRVEDVPSGTAFCMLISRICWAEVGGFDLGYGRGYFEDVDFCLRAKRRGFRNVVAADVYVRHVGGQSFGAEKRNLVAQNALVVQERFPAYDHSGASFLDADPLRSVRAKIEAALVPRDRVTLLVGRPSLTTSLMTKRQKHAGDEETQPLVLAWTRGGNATLRACDGELPQSLRFAPSQVMDLAAYLGSLEIASVEFLEPASVPPWLRPVLSALGAKPTVIVADRASARFVEARQANWLADAAALPVDAMARAAFAVEPDGAARVVERATRLDRTDAGPVRLAALAPVPTRNAYHLVEALDRVLQRNGGEVVTFGPGLNAGTSRPKATGRMDPDDYVDAVRHRRITHLLLPDPDARYGLIEDLQRSVPLPAAFFDWSDGRLSVAAHDLAIPERATLAAAVSAVVSWCVPPPDRPSLLQGVPG